jgi:hypothetical protein
MDTTAKSSAAASGTNPLIVTITGGASAAQRRRAERVARQAFGQLPNVVINVAPTLKPAAVRPRKQSKKFQTEDPFALMDRMNAAARAVPGTLSARELDQEVQMVRSTRYERRPKNA